MIYIFEFPFTSLGFTQNLQNQLEKHFTNGDEKNKYLRSASFDYKNWIESENLKIVYLLEAGELQEYKEYINQKFYQWMLLKIK